MTATPVRVLVWGLGSHAKARILPALRETPGIELAGLLSRDFGKASAFGKALGVPAFTNAEAALSTIGIDAVYVASVTASHFAFGLQVLHAGKHLWSEKPITMSLGELNQLDSLARSKKRVVFETDMFLHHPQQVELRRLIASGDYGPIRSLNARFGFPHRATSEFRYDSTLGGGALADAGFYPIAAAVDLLAAPIVLHETILTSQDGYDVDTDGIALIADADNTPGVLEWGFGRAYRSEIEIWMADAVIRVPRGFAKPADFASEISIRLSDGSVTSKEIPAADPFVAMFEAYLARIRTGTVGVDAGTRQRVDLIAQLARELAD